jgi:Ca-activated chloride channel homolog
MHLRRRKSLWFCLILGFLSLCIAGVDAQNTVPKATLPVNIVPDLAPSPDLEQVPEGTLPGTAVPGADPVGKDDDGRYTLKTSTSEVRLTASVVDGNGRVVQTLGRNAFEVFEDGVPQMIRSFRREDVPVSIGLLIDSSASMFDKRDAVNKASLNLVRLSNPRDQEFLVDFSSQAYIDQGFTSSIEKLKHGLTYVKSTGGTAAYDAIVASADYLAKDAKNEKKVLVVITDGEDTASINTLEQAIRGIQKLEGPTIYCVGLLFGEDIDKRVARNSRRVLEQIARQTGGVAFFPKSLKDVDEIASEVAADIRTQYTIAYRSTNPPSRGGYRLVHVEAKEKGYNKLEVRTRKGYFPKSAGGFSK